MSDSRGVAVLLLLLLPAAAGCGLLPGTSVSKGGAPPPAAVPVSGQEAARRKLQSMGYEFTPRDFFASAFTTDGPEVTRLFLEGGMPPDTTVPGFDGTLLLALLLQGDCRAQPRLRQAALLLIRAGADVNRRGPDGGTPLLPQRGGFICADVVAALLDAGADMKAPSPGAEAKTVGEGLMHNVIALNNPDVVRLLIQRGYDVKADGARLLEMARHRAEIQRILREAGASPSPRATKLGEAAVEARLGAERLTLVRAYAYAVEEGPAKEQQWTVLVLADRELDEARVQDKAWLKAEASAGRLRALRLELADVGGRARAAELLGPRGFARPITASDIVDTDTWKTDRIIGKVLYQGAEWGLSGPFMARIRLGPFVAPSHAAGSLTLAGRKVELKHACRLTRKEAVPPVTRVVLTDRPYGAACTAEPAHLAAAAARGEVAGLAATIANKDGAVLEALCLGGKDRPTPAGQPKWMREFWGDNLMRGRLRGGSGEGCRFDVYFAAEQ